MTEPTEALHIRVPKSFYDKLVRRVKEMRKKDPMANLSDAVRETLERGLK